MLKRRAALIMLAMILCFGSAHAEVGDISYSAWSEWTLQPIEDQKNLFIEKRQVNLPVTRSIWRYTRYALQGTDGTRYLATAQEAPGAILDMAEFEAPLEAVGERDGHTLYQGEWFNQQALVLHDHLEAVTQYRAREIFLESCAIHPASMILEVGEHVQLDIELLDPGAYSLTCDNPGIVSVDQRGLASALSPGRTRITLIYGDQTASCEVMVPSEQTVLDEGASALRLSKTRLTARYDVSRKEVTGLKLAAEAEGSKADPEMRFLLDDVDGDSFSMRALCPRIAYLVAPLSDDGAAQPGHAQVLMLKEILDRKKQIEKLRKGKAQKNPDGVPTAGPEEEEADYVDFLDEGIASRRFRAIRTPEGDLILCLQADNTLALTAAEAAEGAGLAIEKLNLDDPLQRWTLGKEKSDVTKEAIWRLPIAENSFCQITDDFKTIARDKDKHDGIDFSPSGNEDVLAVAAGRVVRVDDRCTHDYKKTKLNKYGRYIDPCDLEDKIVSKYGSYGKYVTIEHEDGTRSMYAHLSKILVKNGQKVKRGQVIGIMGSTGSSCGTHLHFEVRVSGRAVDPRYFLDLPGIGQYVP